VLSSFGRLQVAALYNVDEFGIFIPQIVAKLGNPRPVPIDDPMLAQAIRTKQLTCVRPEETSGPHAKIGANYDESGPIPISETLLAVIPLTDVQGRLRAVVTVQALPFEAISRDHLNLLAVIGGHMGDLLALGVGGAHQFHTALMRGHIDARDHQLAATLMGLRLDSKTVPSSLWREVLDLHRGIDQPWLTRDRHGNPALLLLMPLTDAEGARGFLQRLERHCEDHYGKSLAAAGVRAQSMLIDGNGNPHDKLRALKEACEIHGD
jgi:hypothetical protein